MELTNVFPFFMLDNIINGTGRNSILPGKLGKHAIPMNILSSDFTHLLSGKTSTVLAFAMRHAPFLYSILAVLFGSAKEQVVRAYARTIITAVTNLQSIRDRTIGQFVGYTMRKRTSIKITHVSVSTWAFSTYPIPASIMLRSVYLAPKATFKALPDSCNCGVLRGFSTCLTSGAESIRTALILVKVIEGFFGIASNAQLRGHLLTPSVSTLSCVLPGSQGHSRSAWEATPSLDNIPIIPFFGRC